MSPKCKHGNVIGTNFPGNRFNSTQKEALAQEIFHRVVLEYLTCVYKFLSPEDADKKMHELLES